MQTREELKEIIRKFKTKKILVIGDIMLDQYTFGTVNRISPEAPVPVLKKTKIEYVPGGAANVAHNLVSLGAKVTLSGSIGADPNGKIILNILKNKKVDTNKIITLENKPTTLKERIVSDNNQLLRIDQEETSHLSKAEEERLWKKIAPEIKKSDIVVLSDYDKGIFSLHFTRKIIATAKKENKKVIADFKPKNKEFFIGVDLITPNLKEGEEMTGEKGVEKIGQTLVRDLQASAIITLGSDGLYIFPSGKETGTHIMGTKVKVFDVSGAGDTVLALLALGLSSGIKLEDSARIANYAGGLVVQKPGTATLSPKELENFSNTEKHTDDVEIVPKVWGYEKWLENNAEYCCKLLFLKEGFQGSLHYHKNKDETFLVTKGYVKMELGNDVLHLREGNFVKIEPGMIHRFTGIEDSIILESSTHHDESDVYRKEKSRKVKI